MNRKRLIICLIISGIAGYSIGFITGLFRHSLTSNGLSETAVLRTTGNLIGGGMSEVPPIEVPPSEVPSQPIFPDFTTLIWVIGEVVTILSAFVGLLKWFSWKSKHGKSRTPIVLPSFFL